jgi:histidinol-phosphatase (PHP family)
MMNNYHTHTYRCKHASGDVADYVAAAKAAGLGELGFSDHCPHPDGRFPENRMDMSDLPGYLAALKTAKAEYAAADAAPRSHSPRIIAGLECEWAPELETDWEEEFLGAAGLEYLVAGIHNFKHRGEWRDTYVISEPAELTSFAAASCGAMECGLFRFLAHPDVFCYNWMPWDENAIACARDILATSARTGLPLEINGYGFRKAMVKAPEGMRWPYPHLEFWRLAAEYDITCVVNSDAHRPIDTAASLEDGRAFAARLGLKVLETLPPPRGTRRAANNLS